MTASHLVRLLPDGRIEWLDQAARKVRRADFDTWRTESQAEAVRLLVPGEAVLVTEVSLVARQRHKLLQALPYAVEDQLIGEIDSYHLALGPEVAPDRYLVAAVSRSTLDAWLLPFVDAGIQVTNVEPDTLAVVEEPGALVVVFDDDRALMRSAAGETYAASGGEIGAMIELSDAGRIIAYGAHSPQIEAGSDWDIREPDTPALALLAEWRARARGVDLRQGDYAGDDTSGNRPLTVWRWVAVLLVAVVVTETAVQGAVFLDRSDEREHLSEEAAALLRSSFPEVERVVDPRLQMAQQLEELRRGRTGIEAGVLYLLRLAGPALAADAAVRVRALTYRGGVLTVEVETGELGRVEELRQRLTQGPLQARIESATTLEERVRARLRIGEVL